MNSTKINLKELNIFDLAGNKISITLKDHYHSKIKELLTKQISLYKMGNKLGINYTKIHQAINTNRFPLYIFKEICRFIELKDVEKYIDSYRSYKGRKIIKDPIIKIIESKELTEIAGHMLGDGYLTIKKAASSSYVNISDSLIESFKDLCNKVFGNVDLSIYRDKRFDAKEIKLPNQISLILTNFYPELLDKKVPIRILELPKEFIKSFLRAFADDESCVTTSAITYTQKDKGVLDEIRKLHIVCGFKEDWLTKVKRRGNIYTFSIIGKGLIYFQENIGFKHSNKKRDLGFEVSRKNNKRTIDKIDTIKKEITDFLNKPKTIKELSVLIGVQPTIIRKHMKYLKEYNYVKIVQHMRYNVPLWIKVNDYKLRDDVRKEKILNFLLDNKLSTLEISKKIDLSKDRLMTYLYNLKKEGKIDYTVKGRTYIWHLE